MSIDTTRDYTMTRAMALNLADWHRSSVQHFGVESFYTDSLWWRQPGGSGIYLAALTHDALQPDAKIIAELRAVEKAWGSEGYGIYDCFGTCDLTAIGMKLVVKNPWYLRQPAPPPAPNLPEGFTIEIVKTPQQLADFEWATWEGFEEPDDPEEAFRGRQFYSQHPLGTLDDHNIVYLNGRLEGKVVSSVIIHITKDMQGVYGISTPIPFRRRGYASALMRYAVALRPDLPMSVFPDPETLPIYSVLGFEAAGEIALWRRASQGAGA